MKAKQIGFILTALYCINVSAQEVADIYNNKLQASTTVIDSLNELAFKVKQYNVSEALNALFLSTSLANKIDYQKGLATSFLYEGELFQQCGFFKKALSFYYNSLDKSKIANDSFTIAKASEKIALYLLDEHQPDSAEAIFKQLLSYYEKLKDTDKFIQTKINLSTVKLQQKKFVEADQLIKDALAASESTNYQQKKINALFNLGLLNANTNNLTKADSAFSAVVIMDTAANDKINLTKTYLQLSSVKKQENKYNISAGYALTAYHLSAAGNNIELQQQAAQQLINISDLTDDAQNSKRWQDSLVHLKEKQCQQIKNYAFDFIDVLSDEQIKSGTVQKYIPIAEDASKWQLVLLIIIGALFIAFIVMAIPVYINYRKAKMASKELIRRNAIVKKNASSLDQLNKAISRQNQKLEEENKMKDKLLSIISHDLRHPLVNTKSILDLINEKLIDSAETEELLKQLESQYVRSLNLLDNLLYWIRGQMKGVKIQQTKISIYSLLNSLIEEQRLPIQTKKLYVNNLINQNLELFAEKEMLRIIFRNLLNNAIKFSGEKGEISFSSVIRDGFAYIMIKDNGIGMSREVLEKINVPQYFTLRGTFNEKGSGFGLILVRDLIAKHNGELLIESVPGKGSTFAVKLPIQIRKAEKNYSSVLFAINS
ncbi:MAG: sensor histidine kinase [Chitinophagaceae bacterium]